MKFTFIWGTDYMDSEYHYNKNQYNQIYHSHSEGKEGTQNNYSINKVQSISNQLKRLRILREMQTHRACYQVEYLSLTQGFFLVLLLGYTLLQCIVVIFLLCQWKAVHLRTHFQDVKFFSKVFDTVLARTLLIWKITFRRDYIAVEESPPVDFVVPQNFSLNAYQILVTHKWYKSGFQLFKPNKSKFT